MERPENPLRTRAEQELSRITCELRDARRDRALSQDLLAQRLGVKPGSLLDWEIGRDRPTMINTIHWSRELDLMLQITDKNQRVRSQKALSREHIGWEAREMRRLVLALHAARLAIGRSQADMAAELGVNRWSISQWESGNGNPRPLGLMTWAHAVSRTVALVAA